MRGFRDGASCCVMAEVGSTHCGDPKKMAWLVRECAKAGADVVKFQWLGSATRLAQRRRAPEYEDAYKLIEFDPTLLAEIQRWCVSAGVTFGCSVYLEKDVERVAEHVDVLKVSSFEAGDLDFVSCAVFAAKTRDIPVVISLGGRSQEQAIAIYNDLARRFAQFTWYWPSKVKFLHCVSAYPCEIDDLNLHILREATVRDQQLYAGLSDHTRSVHTGGWAVAAGASILEKHVRHSRTPDTNADYRVSLSMKDFARYVQMAKWAARAMGKSGKERTVAESEEPYVRYQVGR